MNTKDAPEIIVDNDYDGYFYRLVSDLVDKKAESGQPFKSKTIHVNAMPYLPFAVQYERKGDNLHLLFYSALHAGFGHLSEEDRIGLMGIF